MDPGDSDRDHDHAAPGHGQHLQRWQPLTAQTDRGEGLPVAPGVSPAWGPRAAEVGSPRPGTLPRALWVGHDLTGARRASPTA